MVSKSTFSGSGKVYFTETAMRSPCSIGTDRFEELGEGSDLAKSAYNIRCIEAVITEDSGGISFIIGRVVTSPRIADFNDIQDWASATRFDLPSTSSFLCFVYSYYYFACHSRYCCDPVKN